MAFHDEPGPDRVMFCSVGYARGPETRVYMDGSDAGLSRGEVVAALNGWVVDKDTIAELRAQLADRDAEIERLRKLIDDAGAPWIRLDPGVPWEGAIDAAMAAACAEIERLRAERDRAREVAVWVASKVDCSVIPSNNGRKTVRLESFALGVKVIPTDGTDAGILAALEKARGMGSDDQR